MIMDTQAFEQSKEIYVKLSNMVADTSLPLDNTVLDALVDKMAKTALGEDGYTINPTKKGVSVTMLDGSYNSVRMEHQQLDLENLCGELAMEVYKANGGTKYTFAPFLVTSIQVSIAENLGLGM